MTFLPLDEPLPPVFLVEFSQFVHRGHTKVDHYGVGTGFREAADVGSLSQSDLWTILANN